jgi:hypothetical protein
MDCAQLFKAIYTNNGCSDIERDIELTFGINEGFITGNRVEYNLYNQPSRAPVVILMFTPTIDYGKLPMSFTIQITTGQYECIIPIPNLAYTTDNKYMHIQAQSSKHIRVNIDGSSLKRSDPYKILYRFAFLMQTGEKYVFALNTHELIDSYFNVLFYNLYSNIPHAIQEYNRYVRSLLRSSNQVFGILCYELRECIGEKPVVEVLSIGTDCNVNRICRSFGGYIDMYPHDCIAIVEPSLSGISIGGTPYIHVPANSKFTFAVTVEYNSDLLEGNINDTVLFVLIILSASRIAFMYQVTIGDVF